jgi:hypothetical protein
MGGLEPLYCLLISKDHEVLHKVTVCICNLSLRDKSKFKITKSGAASPLISLIQSKDPSIAQFLAEMYDNQDFIAREGAIAPCIAMRSQHIEVQCKSGCLLANLAACGNKLSDNVIINVGGAQFADTISVFPGHLLSTSWSVWN